MPRTTDESRIRALLQGDRAWALYAIGDLTPGHREHCTWFVESGDAEGGVELGSVVLRYHPCSAAGQSL